MTTRASAFVNEWVSENLAREPSSSNRESVEELFQRCLEEASAKGIRPDEIFEEIGDLKSFIKEAMEDRADEEGEDSDPWRDV